MKTISTPSPLMRLMLTEREAFGVPAGYRRLRVRSGRAWVTLAGQDLTLERGQVVRLNSRAGRAVVSPLGRLPVVVELLGPAERRTGKPSPGAEAAG
jgi:Protein of unknown function (DUF2917)